MKDVTIQHGWQHDKKCSNNLCNKSDHTSRNDTWVNVSHNMNVRILILSYKLCIMDLRLY